MNNDKNRRYWFKRRRYGYGWIPVTWQGWAAVLVFLAVVLSGVIALKDTSNNALSAEAFIYLAFLAGSTVLLVIISFMRGPKPKWRWGGKASDNPDEDF